MLTPKDLTNIKQVVNDVVTGSEERLRGEVHTEIHTATRAIMAHVDAKHEQQAATTENGFLRMQELLAKRVRS